MFKSLDQKELSIIIDAMKLCEFSENDMVIKEGEDGDELYVVSSGLLNCFKVLGKDTVPTDLKKY